MTELRLHTNLERAGDVLKLQYEVANQTTRDAYLLNRVHDQSLQTGPDLVYIEFNRERHLIRAYKKIPEIPAGVNPTMPISPYVTPLRAGRNFVETIRIALPIREFKAYTPVPEKGLIVSYSGLRFTLGYYWSAPGMTERAQQIVPGVEVLIPTPPPGTHIEFGEVSSGVMSFDIPVLETT